MIVSRLLALAAVVCVVSSHTYATALDLNNAAVLKSGDSAIVQTARRVLVEEIARRTGITLDTTDITREDGTPLIVMDVVNAQTTKRPVDLAVPEKSEGYAIKVQQYMDRPTVFLAGHDEAGLFYAVGRLLLAMELRPNSIIINDAFAAASAPRFPHRGHQIGYRNLSHCYDAWTPEIYEQYMRELGIFGANAFETTRFRDSGQLDGPHTKLTGAEMATAWSRICQAYGFDFWLFSGAFGGEGQPEEEVNESLEAHVETLRLIPHLDHIYLTGGDGGSTHRRPDLMFEALERFTAEARKIHPNLGVWTSNQGFDPEQNNWFFDYLQREEPEWLTGVVYGAWTRIFADEQRARTPEQYPIRRYDDVGHAVRAQYTVPEWDPVFARTLGREPFAPRPRDHANIHNRFAQYSDGFVTYSDGIGDDVNKFVWSALGWDPDRPVEDIVRDYARFFFGEDIAEEVQRGIFLFEENFSGPLATCKGVEENFLLWKGLEEKADATLLANWRFQSCVMRAYYDRYTQLRLLKALDQESRALAVLRDAPKLGVEPAIEKGRAILAESDQDSGTNVLRKRIEALGGELFKSIGAQLDVENYKARSPERGAILEFLDNPLNNRLWLEDEFDAILEGRATASSPEGAVEGDVRLARLSRVAQWEMPGEGSFYDDLGNAAKQPHLVRQLTSEEDPAAIVSPREGFTMDDGGAQRLSWLDVAECLGNTPLLMRYEGLDPDAHYRLRVTYAGRYNAVMRLTADETYEIHGAYGPTLEDVRYTIKGDGAAQVKVAEKAPGEESELLPQFPLEFIVPKAATEDGALDLRWDKVIGRGNQVAEVWLIKE
jgi:hypothetical protein